MKVNKPDTFWDPMLKACVYGHLNHAEEAGKSLDMQIQLMPKAASQVKNIIESFIQSASLKNEILQGLSKAGLIRPQQEYLSEPKNLYYS
jgi:hypothetical protein